MTITPTNSESSSSSHGVRRGLVMLHGVRSIAKDGGPLRLQGDDAFFICTEKKTVGIANGVGGWSSKGIDAGAYARKLMNYSMNLILGKPNGEEIDPSRILHEAYIHTRVPGSSTVCLVTLKDNNAISRPDLMFCTNYLASFMQTPTTEHYHTAKRVLRYITGTTQLEIWYGRIKSPKLLAFADSDWAGESSMKSKTGYCFSLGSGIFNWSSKKQDCVAQSIGEAEYIVVNMAVKQAIWIRKALTELREMIEPMINIYSDAKAAISIAENPVQHSKTKHINVKYHFIREKIEGKEVQITYIPTQAQLADFFTKSLPTARFQELRMNLGVVESLKQGEDVSNTSSDSQTLNCIEE